MERIDERDYQKGIVSSPKAKLKRLLPEKECRERKEVKINEYTAMSEWGLYKEKHNTLVA